MTIVDNDLQYDIDHLEKLHLLCNQLEMDDDKQLVVVTHCLCHYLTMVAVPAHCKALTHLLLGDHNLSVEHLQYPVRICRIAIKDEVHALLDCTAEIGLADLRRHLMDDLTPHMSSYDFLLRLVASWKAVKLFARFVHDIKALYDRLQRYRQAFELVRVGSKSATMMPMSGLPSNLAEGSMSLPFTLLFAPDTIFLGTDDQWVCASVGQPVQRGQWSLLMLPPEAPRLPLKACHECGSPASHCRLTHENTRGKLDLRVRVPIATGHHRSE
ncbi:hypothetical protein B0H10DRAFT_1940885 [Mycena sp. CBHHK59/15]|nr:hypothetical protein B0H10DRAFT_1940885 [Mycena sp. CBHHK59/15]